MLVGDEGNDLATTPDYFLVDLTGKLSLTRQLDLVLEVRNLFDREFATFGTLAEIDEIELEEAPGASDPRAYAPGMPRRLSVALKARF